MRRFHIIFTSFFYTGFSPIASGTVATLAFIPIYYLLFKDMNVYIYSAITVALYFAGVWSSNYAVVIFKDKDPSKVVIDEVVGYLVTMMFIPFTPMRMVIGFFASRFFDIIKLPPARQAEKLHGGTGIMLDDVIAGVQANICMWVIIYFKLDIYLVDLYKNVFLS
jgi:phosphatidylglycerophosphatase A